MNASFSVSNNGIENGLSNYNKWNVAPSFASTPIHSPALMNVRYFLHIDTVLGVSIAIIFSIINISISDKCECICLHQYLYVFHIKRKLVRGVCNETRPCPDRLLIIGAYPCACCFSLCNYPRANCWKMWKFIESGRSFCPLFMFRCITQTQFQFFKVDHVLS